MSITDRYSGDSTRHPPEYTCPDYKPPPDSKRCHNYSGNGACSRPDQLICVEWAKANGQAIPEQPPDKPIVQEALFGAPTLYERPAPSAPGRRSALKPGLTSQGEASIVRNLSDDEVSSFKALGIEVCIDAEHIGDLWLVPEYTDENRQEISIEHAATLSALCAAFPGARVKSFKK